MASKLKLQEVILQSPNGLQEGTLSISDTGVVSSSKGVTLASPTITGTIPQEAWITPTLLNSWVNFGSGFGNARFMKDTLGFVHINGLVKSGTVGVNGVIFTLPVGYRPLYITHLASVSNDLPVFCRVDPNGNVVAYTGSNVWYSLDTITFKAEQ